MQLKKSAHILESGRTKRIDMNHGSYMRDVGWNKEEAYKTYLRR